MATTPVNPETKTKNEEPDSPVRGALRDAWWATLGLVAVTGEQAGRALGVLVRKGREFEPTVVEHGRRAANAVGETVEGVAGKIGRGAGRAEAALDEKVSAALKHMGFPTQEEVRELSARIEALTARLEQMAARAGGERESE